MDRKTPKFTVWTNGSLPLSMELAGTTAATPEVGRGYSTLSGQLQGVAVESTNSTPVKAGGTEAWVDIAWTSEEIVRSLSIHMSASFDGLAFGGSASLDFMSRHSMDSYTLCIIAHERVISGGARLPTFALTKPASQLANDEGKIKYFGRYGDSFVEQVQYGGSLALLFYFHTTTMEEFESLRVVIEAEGMGWSAAADITKTLEQKKVTARAQLEIFAPGYVGDLPNLKDEAKVLEFVNKFPVLIKNSENVVAWSFSSLPITACDNWPTAVRMDIDTARDQLAECASTKLQGERILADFDFVLKRPLQFVSPDETKLKSAHKSLRSKLVEIDKYARTLIQNPWSVSPKYSALDLEEFNSLIPARKKIIRPAIRAVFSQQDESGMTWVNRESVLDNEPWIGRRPGAYKALTALTLTLDPPIPDTALEFRVQNVGGTVTTPWIPAGGDLSNSKTNPVIGQFAKIAFRLNGALEDSFDLQFQMHISAAGDSQRYPADGDLYGAGGHEHIEALRIFLVPKL